MRCGPLEKEIEMRRDVSDSASSSSVFIVILQALTAPDILELGRYHLINDFLFQLPKPRTL